MYNGAVAPESYLSAGLAASKHVLFVHSGTETCSDMASRDPSGLFSDQSGAVVCLSLIHISEPTRPY